MKMKIFAVCAATVLLVIASGCVENQEFIKYIHVTVKKQGGNGN